jgi:hypothetical protein
MCDAVVVAPATVTTAGAGSGVLVARLYGLV